MLDETDSDKWKDYIMHREKVTIYEDKLLFRNTGAVFTLKGDILWIINEYDFIKTVSPDAKQFIDFFDEMVFDIHGTGQSNRDRNLIKNFYTKKVFTSIRCSGSRFAFRKLNLIMW